MKATFARLATDIEKGAERSLYIVALLSLLFWVHPPLAHASNTQTQAADSALVFNIEPNTNETQTQVALLSLEEIVKNDPLTLKVEKYLTEKGSPLAPCTSTLLKQASWKKILSLSNAESALGKRTIAGTYNYWGVMAGKTLKKMGNDACDAVVNMQKFLEVYPKQSVVKYQDMPLDCGYSKKQRCMNGLYKQPYKKHWTVNNEVILNLMTQLEQEAHQERIARANPTPVVVAAQEIILTERK